MVPVTCNLTCPEPTNFANFKTILLTSSVDSEIDIVMVRPLREQSPILILPMCILNLNFESHFSDCKHYKIFQNLFNADEKIINLR